MTDEEIAAFREQRSHDRNVGEMLVAGNIGTRRGLLEAFGVPLDSVAASVGGESARSYLADLKKWHPLVSGATELAGQAGGFAAQAEMGGAAGLAMPRAASGIGRVAQGIGSGAVRGGLENLVAGTTSDINEAALGDHAINGEKLIASAPGHLFWGGVAGGVLGGAGAGLGEAAGAVAKRAPDLLEGGANRLVGREVGLAATDGAIIRSEMGGVPKDAGEIAAFFGGKQAAAREGAQVARATEMAGIAERQAAEQASLRAAQAEARPKGARFVDDTVEQLRQRHLAQLEEMTAEREQAVRVAESLKSEVRANAKQAKELAERLDAVQGAERPRASVMEQARYDGAQAATGTGPTTPRTIAVLRDLDRWQASFAKQFADDGEVPFTKMRSVADSLDKMAEQSGDKVASGIISHMAEAARAEFDRASAVTAASASEATGLHAETIRGLGEQLSKSYEDAAASVAKHDAAIVDFTKAAEVEAAKAKELAAIAKGEWAQQHAQLGVEHQAERTAQKVAHKAEIKGVQKASRETPYDTIAEAAGKKASGPAPPLMSPHAAMGALISLVNGNVMGAAAAAGSGLAAGLARAHGNLAGARTLVSLAERFRKLDEAISRGARSAVGVLAREGSIAASRANIEDTGPRMSFDRVSRAVQNNAANPQALEHRVREHLGDLAKTAPKTYASALDTANRAQSFLARALPSERRDPLSPTSHLEAADISEAEKFDFMTYVKAITNPLSALKSVRNGSITDREVLAVKEVYPEIYDQMRAEVQRNIQAMQRPIDYEHAIHLGTLLDMTTTEVMEPNFQSAQAKMFADRLKAEQIPGKPSMPAGANARMSKASMSGSEKVESGEGY